MLEKKGKRKQTNRKLWVILYLIFVFLPSAYFLYSIESASTDWDDFGTQRGYTKIIFILFLICETVIVLPIIYNKFLKNQIKLQQILLIYVFSYLLTYILVFVFIDNIQYMSYDIARITGHPEFCVNPLNEGLGWRYDGFYLRSPTPEKCLIDNAIKVNSSDSCSYLKTNYLRTVCYNEVALASGDRS